MSGPPSELTPPEEPAARIEAVSPGELAGGRLSRFVRSEFVAQVAGTFGTRMLLIVLNGANTILLARILGPDGRGKYAVALALAAIVTQVLSMGLQAANTWLVSRDRNNLDRLVANNLAGMAVWTAAIGLLIAVFAAFPSLAPIEVGLLALGLLTVPFGLLTLNLRHLLLGVGDVRGYNLVDIVPGLLSIALILTALLAGLASPGSLLAVAIGVFAIGAGLALRRLWPMLGSLPKPSWDLVRESLGYGIRIYIATGLGFLVLKADLVVVQYMEGDAASGYYSVAASLADMLLILPSVIGAILLPRLVGEASDSVRRRMTRQTLLGLLAVLVPMLAVVALVAPLIVGVMFGSEFDPTASPLQILCAAVLFYGATSIVSQYLAATMLPWAIPAIWGVGFVANMVLNVLLIPPLGIEGAAVASVITYAAIFIAITAYAARFHWATQ